MADSLTLRSLQVFNFRNLGLDPVSFAAGINVVTGRNGEGKTNLLEAIATLGNLRSFRTAQLRRLTRHDENAFRISGVVEHRGQEHRLDQIVEFKETVSRRLLVDRVPVDVSDFLSRFPVFALGPFDRELVVGAPETRRAFVDRSVFLFDATQLEALQIYRRVLKQRNAALASSRSDNDEMRSWERHLAHHGALIVKRRMEAVRRLSEYFSRLYDDLRGPGFPEITMAYRMESFVPADCRESIDGSELEELYFQRYNETRVRDRRAGFTFEGPHRHDVALRADNRPVRDVLSSGQIKIVAAALRLASLGSVEAARGEILPVIVDDIDAELDDESLSRLISKFGSRRQVFLSSTRQIFGEDELHRYSDLPGLHLRMCDGTVFSGLGGNDE